MKRLTKYDPDWPGWPLLERPRGALCTSKFCALSDRCDHIGDRTCPYIQMVDRLAAIEDILGDEYELDRLRELVEVVRCRECRHSSLPSGFTQRYGEPGTLSCHYGPCNRRNVKEDDFCSYGQRKEVDHA